MHELSICQQLLRQCDGIARNHAACKINSITLQLGVLSGIDQALLKQAFDVSRQATLADQAELIIITKPVVVSCPRCHRKAETPVNNLSCPHCGFQSTQLISGEELIIDSVQLVKQSVETESAEDIQYV